jgi:hypothetical protein
MQVLTLQRDAPRVFPPLYPHWANTIYRLALIVIILLMASPIVLPWLYVRSAYNTNQFVPWDQPVEFDHRHHVRDDGIECMYCHSSADRSPHAGVPPTAVCMGCHTQIWNQSPLLEVVRRSYFSGRPINWKRVHDLPDFVYFDHSVHISRGIDCVNCHGDVDEMPRVQQVQPLTMGWCLDCHRRSQSTTPPTPPRLTPPDNAWSASMDMFFKTIARNREVASLTTCTACHR